MANATFEEWYSIYKPVYENNYAAWLRDTGFADFADPKELAEQAAHEDYDNANGDETRITIRPEGWDPDGKLFDEFSKNFTFEQWYAKTKRSYLNSVQKFLDGKEYEYTGIFELVGTTAEEQAEQMARNDFENKKFNATSPFYFDRTTGFFEHLELPPLTRPSGHTLKWGILGTLQTYTYRLSICIEALGQRPQLLTRVRPEPSIFYRVANPFCRMT